MRPDYTPQDPGPAGVAVVAFVITVLLFVAICAGIGWAVMNR